MALDEAEKAQRRVMIEELKKRATDWLGHDLAQGMYAKGQWTGLLNKIDPSSAHCVQHPHEAIVWVEKATLYLLGYKHALGK